MLGLLLVLTFRRRWSQVSLGVVLLAVALEAAQGLIPGRHPRLMDADIKAVGGLVGSAAGHVWFPLTRALGSLSKAWLSGAET